MIDKGNSIAINNLGVYYFQTEKDYAKTKKYFLIAIDKDSPSAMNNLGRYYKEIEKIMIK